MGWKNMNTRKDGLSNTIKAIEEALKNALNTKNKKDKARYIGEAYGMVKVINYVFDEECEEEMPKITKPSKKSNVI